MTHRMNANAQHLRCQPTEIFINSSEEQNAIWYTPNEHGEQSFFCAVQRLSDTSVTALEAAAFEFYPIHLMLLNFTKEWKRHHVQHGHKFVAYLPIQYDSTSDDNHKDDREFILQDKLEISKVNLLENFHFCIDDTVQALADAAVVSIRILASDKKTFTNEHSDGFIFTLQSRVRRAFSIETWKPD